MIGYYVEGSWRLSPEFFAGGRFDELRFDEITLESGESREWDANVRRLELAAGWRPTRQWEIRYAYQWWRYPDFEDFDADFYAIQLTARF
jgi:hypothetical protein